MPTVLDEFPIDGTPLDCDVLVFRAVKGSCKENGEATSQAFILRTFDDGVEDGLSVGNNRENAFAGLKGITLVKSLHVGRIRTLELDVYPDEPTHGNIKELPIPGVDDLRVEQVATALLQQARTAL